MRSFIAIELPDRVKSALSELQQELKQCGADVRWIKHEGIHLTLKFLGDIKEKDADGIISKIEGISNDFSSFTLEVKGAGVFPGIKSPRVVWVGITGNETLRRLHQDIEAGMASLGFEREDRKFFPHLTLGRIKSFTGKDALMEKIATYKETGFGIIDVEAISFMRSDLTPAGAKYTKISESVLKKY